MAMQTAVRRESGNAPRPHDTQGLTSTGNWYLDRDPAATMKKDGSLFDDFTAEDLAIIASYGVVRSYPKGAIVVNEADESDCFCIIRSGRTKVYASDDNGHEVILNTLGPGDYFGELVVIDQAPRSASVATTEKAVLVVVAQVSFERCLTEHPHLAFKLLRPLVRRVRALTRNIKNMALLDVYGRIACLLTEMSTEIDGVMTVDQRVTHQEIASTVGASREMVSRIMRDLEVGGYLRKCGGRLQIVRRLPKSW